MSGTEIRRETWTRAGHTIDDQFAEILRLECESGEWMQLALDATESLRQAIIKLDVTLAMVERYQWREAERDALLAQSQRNEQALIRVRDELREALRKV